MPRVPGKQMSTILEVRNLSRAYASGGRSLTVLDDVSFRLGRRETCAIVTVRQRQDDLAGTMRGPGYADGRGGAAERRGAERVK